MSSHESRESRFDEPLEPDRPIPPAASSADNSLPGDSVDNPFSFDMPEDVWDDIDAEAADLDESDADEADSEGTDSDGHDREVETAIEERWDADDPRRKKNAFAPPTEPCECHCLHCGRTFSSEAIWFQKVINDPQKFGGFWMCPTPNCSGAGFTFDIFPTDPDHPANEGWHYDDDEDFDDDEVDDSELESFDEGWSESVIDGDDDDDADYDPAEPQYKDMDDFFGDEDDDMEGEEWKYGLQPGERPPEPAWREDARREWEEDQKRYDEPDQRPRVLDWSDREDRKDENYFRPPIDGTFSDDDIPF